MQGEIGTCHSPQSPKETPPPPKRQKRGVEQKRPVGPLLQLGSDRNRMLLRFLDRVKNGALGQKSWTVRTARQLKEMACTAVHLDLS